MKKRYFSIVGSALLLGMVGCQLLLSSCNSSEAQSLRSVSGVYPSLAYYNNENECGTGAVVPWADRLWVITYGPHLPFGSSDKLYEITSDLKMNIRKESIGGTPANRMIHRESNQLNIGPYLIDEKGQVRVLGIDKMPGRLTGTARSLTDPANKLCIATMEQGFYEVDVNTLDVNTWFEDGNVLQKRGEQKGYQRSICKGVHGKGYYSGQGVYVFSNNGENGDEALVNPKIEAGSLSEYDGKEWKTVRRNQFTEITGPGGIYGAAHPDTDPIWALGWDYKSVIAGVRDAQKGWRFFRLPKASNAYDGAHGWNTEWPRIRQVGDKYMMTMHGMFWQFPGNFTWEQHAGIRPLSSYLKVIGDFCLWNGQLVFGCDDSAKSEFLNKRKAKGSILAPGQSHSNLWFTSTEQPVHNGTSDAIGAVWEKETVKADEYSEPYLLAGWSHRHMWIDNQADNEVEYTLETDAEGKDQWEKAMSISAAAKTQKLVDICDLRGEWLRVKVSKPTETTVAFVYADDRQRADGNADIFKGIASVNEEGTVQGGLLYALGSNQRKLGILTATNDYYELDSALQLKLANNPAKAKQIKENMAVPHCVVTVDKGSYLIIDDAGRRWRLPKNEEQYDQLVEKDALRICREVSTERDLFSLGGTFFELPAENADGYAKIRPVSTHHLQIADYASYRGMLVLTGLCDEAQAGEHVIVSDDGQCKLWCGVIDDLWKMGKPTGKGGPWVDANTQAGVPSDAYLIGHYDKKQLTLLHQSDSDVVFTVEMDPTGDGTWMKYADLTVSPGQSLTLQLPNGHLARWIRFTTNKCTTATAWLDYQ